MNSIPESHNAAKRTVLLMLFFSMLSIGLFVADLVAGSIYIPVDEIINVLIGAAEKPSWQFIVFDFRLPKAITAVLVGSGLSVAGLLMQTLFRNALAGPFVLGINSGASLGVALFVLGGSFTSLISFSGASMAVSAIVGASVLLLTVLFVSMRIQDSVSLLIVGIMFGSLAGSVVSILQYFSTAENVQRFVIWTFGSLSGVNWQQLQLLAPFTLIGTGISLYLIKQLNALLLGEQYAKALGVKIVTTRFLIIVACSLIAGSITAFAGPIAFIGVAVPHLARNIFRSSNHAVVVPASIFIGICLMLLCDIISQLPGQEAVLPINAVTALFGAPVVIWVIIRSKTKGRV